MRFLTLIAAAATLAICIVDPTTGADVIHPPPSGYTESIEFNDVEFGSSYSTPNGVPYTSDLGPQYGLTGHSVGWQPKNLPLYLEVGHDARGAFLLLTTLAYNPAGRAGCFAEQTLEQGALAATERLWQMIRERVSAWATACPLANTFGTAAVETELSGASDDFRRALKRLAATRRSRYLKLSDGEDGRTFGLPTFLPGTTSQPVLDALADGCKFPRSRVWLGADTRIELQLTPVGQSPPQGEVAAENCIARATEFLPGRKR